MIILVIVSIFCGAFCYLIAQKKQANPFNWLLIGLLAGPFAIPFVFFAKPAVIDK
jgi:hypothetical protein